MRYLLFLWSLGCAKYGPVQYQHKVLGESLEQALGGDLKEWSKTCAPRQLALAISHKEFAELEFEQGDVLRAEEHLVFAQKNIDKAIRLAEKCRPKDRDDDGLVDKDDQCPDEPETVNAYKDDDGCPEIDTDKDGIFDDSDRCKDTPEDIDMFQDEDGCPEEDNDNDGFLDAEDKCPNNPEDYDGYRDQDGCPEETGDADGDGILDDVDACVDQPETKNNYLDKDGCPDRVPKNVRITNNQIIIDQKILFATGKAIILKQSYGILNSVAQVLRDYSQIKVLVEGHTDSVGSDSYNLKLSQRRAKSVRQHLIKVEKIAADRLTSKGFGETKPIDSNDTMEGKERNRRVEFTIVQGMEKE